MILLGSRALCLRAAGLIKRAPVDFDFLCTKDEFNIWIEKNYAKVKPTKIYELPEHNKWVVEASTPCEFEIITTDHSSELLADLVYNDKESLKTKFGYIPSLNILKAIKTSHRYKKFETPRGCANWYKHAVDWHMLNKAGVKILPEHQDFISLREKETYIHKLPNLNVSKEEFFDSDKNGVKQIFIHDDIHKAIAINEKPAYEYYLKDGSEVLTSKKKFFECSEHIRLCGVIEEAMVLFLERSYIPHNGKWAEDFGFKFALAKAGSTITGGYFREYIWDHLFEAIKKCPVNFTQKFQKNIDEGNVRQILQS